MIRPDPRRENLAARLRRRQLLRLGVLGTVILALAEFGGFFTGLGTLLPGFFRPLKTEAFGGKIDAGISLPDLLTFFKNNNDEPYLNTAGRFFILHPEANRIMAVYRKCTHLGCTVPWNAGEDQFHCPCHGSLYDKHTAVVKGGPAPRPLDVFPITIQGTSITVDTNPTTDLQRTHYDQSQSTAVQA